MTPEEINAQVRGSDEFIKVAESMAVARQVVIDANIEFTALEASHRRMLDQVTKACVEAADQEDGVRHYVCPTVITTDEEGSIAISKSWGYCDECPFENLCQSPYRTWTD
jgi:hypothetical protein